MSELDHWFVRIDRYASVHLVRSQDQTNSCAMASIAMVNFKMKKGLLAAGVLTANLCASAVAGKTFTGYQLGASSVADAVRSEAEVRALYRQVAHDPSHDFVTTPATRTFYPSILQRLGLGRWELVNVGQGGVAQAAKDATADGSCCILSVSFQNSGHAVVCDETHSLLGDTLCICDPWDGELRLVPFAVGSPITYDAGYKPYSLTFGGTRRPGGGQGVFNGWITRRIA
jgi:hypothetical protein